MALEVVFRPSARADLFEIYDYVAEKSGLDRAARYIERIEAACRGLTDFPERGTKRDDVMPGLRTLAFERRIVIAFRVRSNQVEIVAVFYGGREVRADRVTS